ncbi:hypothetical protein [Bacteroides thetaiotaomicron]
MLDGYAARKMSLLSVLGANLDSISASLSYLSCSYGTGMV